MTDVTVTVPSVETDEVYSNPCIIDTVVMNFRLYLFDANLNPFNEIHFESLFGGNVSQIKHFILRNGGVNPVDATIQMIESESQVGLDLETYLSCYISTDQATWEKELPLTVNGGSDLDFYLRYQPPSNALVGEKEWALHIDLDNAESSKISNNSFTVTSTSASDETNVEITVTIPYAVEVMRTDFGDVRFYEGLTELEYHLKEKTDGISATFVIKLPSFGAGEEKEITVYAGDPSATTTSDPDNVYLFYDDFTGSSLDLTKWYANGVVSLSNGQAVLVGTNLRTKNTFTPPYSLEYKIDTINDGWGDARFGVNINGYNVDPVYMACINAGDTNPTLYSPGCVNYSWTKVVPAIFEMNIVSASNYTNYLNGVSYQNSTTSNIPSNAELDIQAGTWRAMTLKLDYVIVHKYPSTSPLINDLGQWSLGVTDKEIKAGILFSEGVLEGEENGQVKHGLEIDGHIYF